ncbi:MAG: single-stranded DNA-binding protein [Pseudonocardia sp.]
MNEITIHGNLTDEPTLRYSSEAKAVVNFTVAVNRRRLDRQTGQWVDQAPVFHRGVAFGLLAENAANLPKGTAVTVTGELADDSWTTPEDGKRVYRTQLLAADVAVSLRFATVEITKNPRRGSNAAPETVGVGG